MKIPLREACAYAALMLAQFTPHGALAQSGIANYPRKPVRLVVPFAPGGTDLVARVLGKKLSDTLGQPFVIDNRPGAGGAIGAEMTARAAPDGYTLLLTNPGPGVHSVLLRKQPAYTLDDFAPVIYIGYAPLIVVANPKFPPNNASELIAYARANPGKVSWGSAGVNSNPHISLELLKSVANINIVHVPYKGSAPAQTDLIAGQIDAMYTTTISATGHVQAGRLKVLGVAGAKRSAVIPDAPTFAELGIKGADALVWLGLVSAAKTPRIIVTKLNHETNKALQSADVRQQLAQLGIEIEGGTPEKFAAFIRAEAESLTRLIKAGTVKGE